jgi:hypothetical protein
MAVTPELRRPRQEDTEFEIILGYLKKPQNTKIPKIKQNKKKEE